MCIRPLSRSQSKLPMRLSARIGSGWAGQSSGSDRALAPRSTMRATLPDLSDSSTCVRAAAAARSGHRRTGRAARRARTGRRVGPPPSGRRGLRDGGADLVRGVWAVRDVRRDVRGSGCGGERGCRSLGGPGWTGLGPRRSGRRVRVRPGVRRSGRRVRGRGDLPAAGSAGRASRRSGARRGARAPGQAWPRRRASPGDGLASPGWCWPWRAVRRTGRDGVGRRS